ncbi:MAG: hypothetical protein M3O82_04575 [Verrucomicrobiota bacterium]|nr:hypothetical protein [Verrucomicrobiota bacterium]
MGPLHVITAIFNPRRFESRYRNYHHFAKYVADSGAILHTVEMAFGARPHEVTTPGNPHHLQFRTHSELWHKERLLNLAIAHVCRQNPEAKYFAWIDADVTFSNPNWAHETVHRLQHYHVLQMFETAHNLGPDGRVLDTFHGMVAGWESNGKIGWNCPNNGHYGFYYHPGFCWAATRWALDQLGGLFDVCVAGSGDTHMAGALCGDWRFGFPKQLQEGQYGRALQYWAARADRSIERNVSHLPGSVFHAWHGKAKQRGYDKRWQMLIDHGFDPSRDLQNDVHGALAWSGANPNLQHSVRRSLAARNEDSTDL